ncbi:precorrin-3B synthase [Granulicella mallensis]|uniref:Sulfite reductase (Ferredoxin) n=1 Tax=Granulicella mallensis (strain ATCC BAA-1857 / DSM 23137 / MP5ACTX8) TaxID=682795 RepID=G8NNW9_GRAMM|nr:precorrin-3B synthase [Granulicella mallensis]AEU37073.1 Sulfite reductase (ferredoxin) [Granulicella mallensis MP5ACTX8]
MSDTATPATPVAAPKETKAQKVERLKREKNPWNAWDEVRQFASEGRDSVLPEWTGTYFKWWGVYTQGDGVGVTGGVGGEGKASEYFMMRIGLPNGMLTAKQLHVIADITAKYARGIADITTRQNIQLHWLTIESLPEVVDALTAIGLSPKGACGDVVRNVTGCPLAGLDADELIDASPLAVEIAHKLTANPEFYNLPRKFKITVTGCPLWCSYPEINDVALTALKRVKDGKEEIGYSLRVGGGLSTEPHLAVRMNAFIPQDKAYDAVKAVCEIFREQEVLRENRTRARIKYLFMRNGWTAETMLAAIEEKLGFKFDPCEEGPIAKDLYRDHVGVHRQKQEGLSYVGATVLNGRLTADQLHSLASLSETYGDGQLRATIGQNIVLVNIPNAKIPALVQEITGLGLQVEPTVFYRGAVACTGTEFCKLAIAETKGFTKWLVGEMEERLPEFDQQLRLHVTGCTNSCGQSWIADLGLEGKKIKKDGKMVDAYYFCVGGAVGEYAGIARQIGYRATAEDCPEAIERLLRGYLSTRAEGESLRSYFRRTSDEDLRAQLAGAVVSAVERDPAPGRVPANVG